ncbi:ABC transporter permease [Desulfospira joergensenii]|uniref:ABC transporter permease n=1 Tax=Desulfospira joergensenii TaxID=53329 RepID=UPI0003B71FA0|nr:FtsX-like permease family protein [Desulfospira joergensenii]
MKFWLGMGLRELIKARSFSLFFILNLSLGLAGFIAIQSFSFSLNRHMDENLKEILKADLVLAANSPLTPADLDLAGQVLGKDVQRARLVTFFTMVRGGDRARMVRVMAMDEFYPLYGAFAFEGDARPGDVQSRPGLFMTRDTARTLGIQNLAGKEPVLRLGHKNFFIRDFFRDDPDTSLTEFELAPKIYMGLNQLEGTGLVQFGSRIRYRYFYRFNREVHIQEKARELKEGFFELSQGQPRINVFGPGDVNRRLGRLTRYFTRYMGLVSIVALFLAGMAAAYLFRGFLNLKSRQTAILMSMGGVRREIYLLISFQLMVLGSLASLLAALISIFLLPAFPVIFKGLMPAGLTIALDTRAIGMALGLGMAGSLVFCLPLFARIFTIKPLTLLRAGSAGKAGMKRARLWAVVSSVPGILALFFTASYTSGSFWEGMIFSLGFILALGFFFLAGMLIFLSCKIPARMGFMPGRIAFRNLFRNKWSSLSCFVTIAMGIFLISVIPQVRKGLETEIMRPEGLKVPVFFLVDIQEDQQKALMEFIAAGKGDLTHISPMVRGRILSVNDKPFFRKDRKTGNRGLRLEFNFSHRKDLYPSEKIVQGNPMSDLPWDFGSEKPFEISMEQGFADRMGLKMGDVMGFDVQGIPLRGRVVNLRRVRWASFQPNFFMLFQDGVLDDAPKTYLATISNLAPEQREDLKNRIVDRFPNISVIDVARTAATILDVTDRLSLSVRFMAWLALAAGLVSVFSIARHEARKSEAQINLLKVMGADFQILSTITLVEFGFIGFSAGLFALALSTGFSLGISGYFFDSLWAFDLGSSALILVSSTAICMATGLGAAYRIMKTKPLSLLSGGGAFRS